MIPIKASQKTSLMPRLRTRTGICADISTILASVNVLGFFASAAESLGNQVEIVFFQRHGT